MGIPVPIDTYISITAFAFMTQGASWKKGWIDIAIIPRSLLRNSLINKIRTDAISVELLLWKREISCCSILRQRATDNQ